MDADLIIGRAITTELIWILGLAATSVATVIAVLCVGGRPRNRRRHRLGTRLLRSGQLRRMP